MTESEVAWPRRPGLVMAVIAAIMAASACSQPGGSASSYGYGGDSNVRVVENLLRVDGEEYGVTGLVTVHLTNRLGRAVGYNLCRSRLERFDRESDSWGVAVRSLAELCTAEIRTLGPGQAVTYSFRPTMKSQRGALRVSTDLQDLHARIPLIAVSNSFLLSADRD